MTAMRKDVLHEKQKIVVHFRMLQFHIEELCQEEQPTLLKKRCNHSQKLIYEDTAFSKFFALTMKTNQKIPPTLH